MGEDRLLEVAQLGPGLEPQLVARPPAASWNAASASACRPAGRARASAGRAVARAADARRRAPRARRRAARARRSRAAASMRPRSRPPAAPRAGGSRPARRLVPHVGQRRPAPERQCLAQRRRRVRRAERQRALVASSNARRRARRARRSAGIRRRRSRAGRRPGRAPGAAARRSPAAPWRRSAAPRRPTAPATSASAHTGSFGAGAATASSARCRGPPRSTGAVRRPRTTNGPRTPNRSRREPSRHPGATTRRDRAVAAAWRMTCVCAARARGVRANARTWRRGMTADHEGRDDVDERRRGVIVAATGARRAPRGPGPRSAVPVVGVAQVLRDHGWRPLVRVAQVLERGRRRAGEARRLDARRRAAAGRSPRGRRRPAREGRW